SPDVDHLHDLVLGLVAPPGDRGERIEVDTDEVERLDPVLREGLDVLLQPPPRQDAGVDPGMEGLHAAAQHLGLRGHVLDARHLEPLRLEERGGSSRRHQLPAERGEALRELLDSVLVPDRDQRTRQFPLPVASTPPPSLLVSSVEPTLISSLTTSGSRRCSTAWMRSTSVSAGSTTTSSCRITAPVSSPSSTER